MQRLKQKLANSKHAHTVRSWFSDHKKAAKTVVLALLLVLLASVLIQLLYPSSYSRPFTRISSLNSGINSSNKLIKQVSAEFKNVQLRLKATQKTYVMPAAQAGISVDSISTVNLALKYPILERLVPFSIFFKVFEAPVKPSLRIDQPKLQYFAENVKKENTTAAINATISIKDGKVVVTEGQNGATYTVSLIVKQLKNIYLKKQVNLSLNSSPIKPERTSQDVKPLVDLAAQLNKQRLTISLNGQNINVAAKTVASWIDFKEDKNHKLSLVAKQSAVQKYLDSIAGQVYIAPGTTVIHLLDGKEISHAEGAYGRTIDSIATIKDINKFFADPSDRTVVAPVVALAPHTSYVRNYTQSQAGLQALLNYLAKSKGNYGISVNELSGAHRVASANGSKQYRTASTYKLFVAYSVLKKIENKSWKWSTKIDGDKTVEQCFDVMIINSDNPCAEKFGESIGWTNIHNQMRALGLSSTALTTTFVSTANDEALFLRKLQDGSLLSSSSRSKLLDVMKRQIYRAGIPTGAGVPVADKVGFLEGYLHDAAIVYAPGRTYVLVILTYGSSWGQIADTARQIQEYFNQ